MAPHLPLAWRTSDLRRIYLDQCRRNFAIDRLASPLHCSYALLILRERLFEWLDQILQILDCTRS